MGLMRKISRKIKITKKLFRENGVKGLVKRTRDFAKFHVAKLRKVHQEKQNYRVNSGDILFITEYRIPYIERYRTDHPMEELRSHGVSCDKVRYDELDMKMLARYRGFVFYRTPMTDTIREFITEAKKINKTVFFSVDDLVFDTKFTNKLPYVKKLSKETKEQYDRGVREMGEVAKMCDYAIVTTNDLRDKLGEFGEFREIFVNRNIASEEMLKYSLEAIENQERKVREKDEITLGYFSGSITHNDDFAIILPAITNLMKENSGVRLKLVGEIDLPDKLKEFSERIDYMDFREDFRELPAEIAEVDINLAPLAENIFNLSKSEIKWMEAALVKVPTIASNVGAFASQIKNGETGILSENTVKDWTEKLRMMINDKKLREKIAENSFNEVKTSRIATKSGKNFVEFVREKLKPNVVFYLTSVKAISGGNLVIRKHVEILRKNGVDASMIDIYTDDEDFVKNYDGNNIIFAKFTDMNQNIDNLVATFWPTVGDAKIYPNKKKISYLVQSYETDFYDLNHKSERFAANSTYMDEAVNYVTISKWCKKWLAEDFSRKAKYAPNGIDFAKYKRSERKFTKNRKIRVLIEGPNDVEYKKVDESMRIANLLDHDKYEVNWLTYKGVEKDWYKLNKVYTKLSSDEAKKVYAENDILIKSSNLESFSYPPLEMMATGGFSILVANDGNREFVIDGKNALYYEEGNFADAVAKIEMISNDEKLREILLENGLKTAEKNDWSVAEKAIIEMYK